LSFSYALGILVDRFAMVVFDTFVRPLTDKLPKSRVKKAVKSELPLMQVLKKEGKLAEHLQDLRSRQRIARATVFNIALACLAFVLTPNLKLLMPKSQISFWIVVTFCAIVFFAAIAAWAVLDLTYKEKLEQVEKL
jgi:hypothetical protein